jgi:DNA-directed RNA polymerase specialized sigma24 family protein
MDRPRSRLSEALHSEAFVSILPALLAYASRRLRRIGWASGIDRAPSAAEAGDVVNGAVEACLEGAWVWPDDMDLETFISGVMWSQLGHQKRKASRTWTRSLEDAEELAAQRVLEELVEHRRLLAAVGATLADDDEASAVLRAIDDGNTKRAQIAAELGWSVERLKAVRVRMNRRLAAAGVGEAEDE